MNSFKALIQIIGINPYVLLPEKVLHSLFTQAGRNKGPIPVKGKINGKKFIQTLVRYSGQWRLYLNNTMRVAAKADVGDTVSIDIEYDAVGRIIPLHPELKKALHHDPKAKMIFDKLTPSLRKELVRYIHHLKTEAAVERNIAKTILFLHGKQRHIGRDKP